MNAALMGVLLLLALRACGQDGASAGGPPDWNLVPPVRWVDRPNVLPGSPTLAKSLGDAAECVRQWTPPADAADWERRRAAVVGAFRKAIGMERLPKRTALNARVTARHDFDGYSVENVVFESRPGFPVTANLYRPAARAAERRPAVLSPIGHFLSAGKTATDVQLRCLHLARAGFVVLAYDALGQGERMVPGNIHHEAGYALLPLGQTIAGWMVWDSMRAIDFLLTLEDVDPGRIGITGNSGGGLNSLFTAALDDRVQAATVVGFTFEFGNWLKYGGTHCTCTHLPGAFQGMEWFEIAGLVAPRALMMIQGANDGIFPIAGARRSGARVEQIYGMLGAGNQARFVELPGMPHAYSRPFREVMYGWMDWRLRGRGDGAPVGEIDMTPLPEKDSRLLCDPERRTLPQAPTVLDLALREARERLAALPDGSHPGVREGRLNWVRALVAPPDALPHWLSPRTHRREAVPGGVLDRVSFNSEDGVAIPSLLWIPTNGPGPFHVAVLADARGKAAIAESGLATTLLAHGIAVMAPDLRGRGETLDRYGPRHDINFRLVANQVLLGRPLAGRRAFDLRRVLDYIGTRTELTAEHAILVGLGEDALPATLAAVVDPRVGGLVVGGYVQSLVSQMRARIPPPPEKLADAWNDPQLDGTLDTGAYRIDLGSVVPSMMEVADLPDLWALMAPRPILVAGARDHGSVGAAAEIERCRSLLRERGAAVHHRPERNLDAPLLLDWIRSMALNGMPPRNER